MSVERGIVQSVGAVSRVDDRFARDDVYAEGRIMVGIALLRSQLLRAERSNRQHS